MITFEEVYEENYSYVYNIIYSRLLNSHDTEDMVSDVFFKAMDSFKSYDSSKASVRTWLATIAKNRLIDYYRSSARKKTVLMADDDMTNYSYEDEYSVEKDEVSKEAHRILAMLNDEERELLTMRYFMEMKNPDIAQQLGISAKAVCERYRRLLKKCEGMIDKDKIRELLA